MPTINVGYRVELYRSMDWKDEEVHKAPDGEALEKVLDRLERIANWIDEEPYAMYYYPRDLKDASKIKSKAIEIYDKAGYAGKDIVHLVQQRICREEGCEADIAQHFIYYIDKEE